jgi:hypothetical protein
MNQGEDSRWWIDRGPRKTKEKPSEAPLSLGGASYDELRGYDQEKVRASLSHINLKLLEETNPFPGSWNYVSLKPERRKLLEEFEKLKKACPLPEPLRGVAIDCGYSLRLLITGEPLGAKILEVHLSDAPSLDFWELGHLVREGLFSSREEALEAVREFLPELLLPPRKEILG